MTLPDDFASLAALPGSTKYTVKVRAHNSLGAGPWSPLADMQTAGPPDKPAAPVLGGGVPGVQTTTAIHVVWTEPDDHGKPIDTYYLRVDGETHTLSPDALQYLMVGVVPGSSHTVAVRAKNEYGNGAWSDETTLTADSMKPETPEPPSYIVNLWEQVITVNLTAPRDNGKPITEY